MAVEMLWQAKKQNVKTIVATPHFNFEDIDIDVFFEKREQGAKLLEEACEGMENMPRIIKGAEVYLTPDMADRKRLRELCIEGTDCILIELPIGEWTGWIYNEIYKIRTRDMIPVLAHLERYVAHKSNIKKIERLLEMEVCVQINADDVGKFRYNSIIKKIIKSDKLVVLGSDTHNPVTRANKIEEAIKKLKGKYGKGYLARLENNAEMLLNNEFSF